MKGAIRNATKEQRYSSHFYQEKDATKKKGSRLVALPFKVDGKVVFFE